MEIRPLGQEGSPGGGPSNPLQYSCLENPIDRGAWKPTVHGVIRARHNLVTKLPHSAQSLSHVQLFEERHFFQNCGHEQRRGNNSKEDDTLVELSTKEQFLLSRSLPFFIHSISILESSNLLETIQIAEDKVTNTQYLPMLIKSLTNVIEKTDCIQL